MRVPAVTARLECEGVTAVSGDGKGISGNANIVVSTYLAGVTGAVAGHVAAEHGLRLQPMIQGELLDFGRGEEERKVVFLKRMPIFRFW